MSTERCVVWAHYPRSREDKLRGTLFVVCVETESDGERLCSMLRPKWSKRAELCTHFAVYTDDNLRALALERKDAEHPHSMLVRDAQKLAADAGIALVEARANQAGSGERVANTDGGTHESTPKDGLWPAHPFDPDCRETVPVDSRVTDAMRTLIRDWNGDNWSAVEQYMRLHSMPSDRILTMTPHDVRMWFAQAPAVVRCATETATHTVYTLPAPPPAPTEVAGRSDPAACGESTIPLRARKAAEQYKRAAEVLGNGNPTDREAYDQLVKAHEQSGEAVELPTFDTWQRNLREYRQRTRTQKNKLRAGRAQPQASCAWPDQLNVNELPTSIRPTNADA